MDQNQYIGRRLLIFTAFFIPIQVICVLLRYATSYFVPKSRGWDDLIILIVLISQMGMAGISIGSLEHAGVGYHQAYLAETDPQKLANWAKYLTAIEFVYLGFVNVPKVAILLLYNNLFPRHMRIHIYIQLMMGYLVLTTISTLIAAFTICRPFAANYDMSLAATHCGDREGLFVWASFPNIISDLIILVMPLPIVIHLKINTRLKMGLLLTFVVGSFGLVTSIVRFSTFFTTNSFTDGTWNAVNLIIWTQIETGMYMISACLPTYRRFLKKDQQSNNQPYAASYGHDSRTNGRASSRAMHSSLVDHQDSNDTIPLHSVFDSEVMKMKAKPNVQQQPYYRLNE